MHDSHIHLNLEPLNRNIPEIIDTFVSNGGKHILTQSTDNVDIQETLDIAAKYPDIIDVALGLHPTIFEETTILKGRNKNLYEFCNRYINEFESQFEKNVRKVKAVGETGLDYFQFNLNQSILRAQQEELQEIQKLSFRRQIALARKYNLPLSIHARDIQGRKDTVRDVLRILVEEGKGEVRGSFHSYTGDISFIEDILALGFYVGFNAIITYPSGENVREILKQVPLDRILFETDGPLLPPQSVRKDKKIKEKFGQPADVREIIEVAAEIKGVSMEKLESITDENYKTLFL
jgi:TatD DNase family protein